MKPSLSAGCLVGMLLLTGLGCGKPPLHEVTGTVSFAGKELDLGTVTFVAEPPAAFVGASEIGDDGVYRLAVPAGDYRVTVATPLPQGPAGAPPAGTSIPAGMFLAPGTVVQSVQLPARYSEFGTTDLRCTVGKGPQQHDISLAP